MTQIETKTEPLLCDLTADQRAAYQKRLLAILDELDGVALRKKAVTADLSAEAKRLEAEKSQIATKLRSGQELRDVQVEVVRDYEHAEVREVRVDTAEVVRVRTMTRDELQLPIPGTDGVTTEDAEDEKAGFFVCVLGVAFALD